MRKSWFSLFHAIIVTSLVLSACASPSDPAAAQTAAAQTLDAALGLAEEESALQTAEAENAALQATNDALATANAELQSGGTATANAAATLAAVPTQLIAPNGASCRVGPDGAFAKTADLVAGQAYDVFARSLDGEWWQIASPDGGGETCWVFWDDALEFTGEVFNLPLVAGPSLPTATVAPTHAPGISVRFIDDFTCSGVRFALVRVVNLGPDTYQSAIVILADDIGDEITRSDGNNEFFPTADPCGTPGPTLGPGQEKYVSVRITGAAPGDTLRIRVIVCTEKGAGGECVSGTLTFVN